MLVNSPMDPEETTFFDGAQNSAGDELETSGKVEISRYHLHY